MTGNTGMGKIGNLYVPNSVLKYIDENDYDDFANWFKQQGQMEFLSDANGSDIDKQIYEAYMRSKSKSTDPWKTMTDGIKQGYGIM